jgi:hypothetical protein
MSDAAFRVQSQLLRIYAAGGESCLCPERSNRGRKRYNKLEAARIPALTVHAKDMEIILARSASPLYRAIKRIGIDEQEKRERNLNR